MNNSSGTSLDSYSPSTSDSIPGPEGPTTYGYSPAVAGYFDAHQPQHRTRHPANQHSERGRVVRLDRNLVLTAVGGELLHLPYPLDAGVPVTGDWVWIGPNRAGGRQITGILPRRSELSRKRAFEDSSEAQVLAANMDVVGVVVPVDRPLTHNRLERTLVAAWDSGAVPLVIITKADLADIADDVVGKVILQAAGVDVVTTSAENGDGIDALLEHLPPHGTLVLLGPSGAGKSTLINALAGRAVQHTREVRSGDFKGKHTTTSRELVPLPNGAVLMDTPGVRGFGLFDADEGLGEMFGDVEELAGLCRFSNCAHQQEPGCAVQAALADGTLDERRWLSYGKLQRELAALARRTDAAARRAYQREWHQRVVVAGKSQRSAERDSSERREDQRSKRKRR
ncbi:ribosome small subunit-dependent GTPase A [Pseudarthrobacter raffinosi]|uniref:ribosome small subunit-dependent GTPase A n=1 Tax=Pseudarthrobacter raffinosi TaxID=2953651 RepID=UPI00208E031F|nr:ribosome small subunit-dependent GTPase A [Pseudarthrobacter sp. MDT3-9]MCO4249890.1 ribosome small subunit-dependent GTPase A [Pseudarthrobacter sp. MDT3-9]